MIAQSLVAWFTVSVVRATAAIWISAIAFGVFALPACAASPNSSSHCTGTEVRATIVSFASALNRGDLGTLDSLFAPKPDFEWYSTDGRIGKAAKRRDTLIPYFRRRHARGEKLGLKRFRFTGNSPRFGNFEMTMRRRVLSSRHARWNPIPGKGAAICREGNVQFIVMSFGTALGH